MVNKLEAILEIKPVVDTAALNAQMKAAKTAMQNVQASNLKQPQKSSRWRRAMAMASEAGVGQLKVAEIRKGLKAQVGKWNAAGQSGFGAGMNMIEQTSINAPKNLASIKSSLADITAARDKAAAKAAKQAETVAKYETRMAETAAKGVERAEQRKVAAAKAASTKIKNSFSAAFSLHIITQFVSPFLNRLQAMMTQTISTFAEFDKLYADYLAKSSEFPTTLSQSDIFKLQAGQTYAIGEVAEAMERFSASGIDVTKNTQAITDVLQVATIANIDFKESANSVIKTLEAFHLSVDNSTMIVDAMTAAANASTAELSDMVSWFEFAAGSAYQAGLEVQDLSAYLGILSSSGLANVGTAFRQFLVQFQKADVREKFAAKFGFATEDFRDMNKVINTMRNYVQGSGDAKAAAEELTQMLGGKVNAMESLGRLLTAQPELWDRLRTAVTETGVTSDLYAEVTDNAAHAIERIQNTIESFYAQIGSAFGPVLKVAADLLGTFAKALAALPSPIHSVIGVVVVFVGLLSGVTMALVTVVSLMAVMQGATQLFMQEGFKLNVSTKALMGTFIEFGMVLTGHAEGMRLAAMSEVGLTEAQIRLRASTIATRDSLKSMNAASVGLSKGLAIGMTAMVGFGLASRAAAEDSYEMAEAINAITAAIVAFQVMSGLGWGKVAIGAGLLAGGGLAVAGHESINRARLEGATNAAIAAQATGVAGLASETNIYVNELSVSGDSDVNSLVELVGGDEYGS